MESGHQLTAAVLCCLVVAVPAAIPSGAAGTDRTASLSTVQETPDQNETVENETAIQFAPNVTGENDRTLEAFTTGGANFSARPPHATWDSCCSISVGNSTEEPLISEAYIAIFSTSPSTVAHTHNGTQRYVRPNGTVRTMSNLRLNLPSTESAGAANGSANSSSNVSANSTGVTLTRLGGETELLVNGTVVDSAPANVTTRLQYENVSGTVNLTVRMRLQATIRVNESNSTEQRDYNMTVTDSRVVRVQNLSVVPERQQIAWINEPIGPNESVIATTVPGMWHRVSFANGPTVTSKWRYFTRYNDTWQQWDTWETVGNESAVNGPTRIAPEEVHAVPVAAGPEMGQVQLETDAGNATSSPYLWLEYPDSNMTAQPPLPPDIQIDRTGQSTTSDTFTIHSETSLRGLENYTVHGIVRGHRVNRSINQTDPDIVREPNLAVRGPALGGRAVPFENVSVIRVFSSGVGGDIRQGRLLIETRQCSTTKPVDVLGVSRIALDQSNIENAQVTYKPNQTWWNQSRRVPVQSTTAYYVPDSELPPSDDIIWFAMSIVVAFLPLVLLFYGFDVMSRGKLLGWYNS